MCIKIIIKTPITRCNIFSSPEMCMEPSLISATNPSKQSQCPLYALVNSALHLVYLRQNSSLTSCLLVQYR
jgi:hypothetical protein